MALREIRVITKEKAIWPKMCVNVKIKVKIAFVKFVQLSMNLFLFFSFFSLSSLPMKIIA